jgi:hypothetical protein
MKYFLQNFFNLRNPELWSCLAGTQLGQALLLAAFEHYYTALAALVLSLALFVTYALSISRLINSMNTTTLGSVKPEEFAEFNKHLQEMLVNKFPESNPVVRPTPELPEQPKAEDGSK